MDNIETFEHFLSAQAGATSGYVTALSELESGHKAGHWIWYIFPQLAGLGRSGMSQKFAISGDAEARAYLVHPVLGPRLLEALQVVLRQISPPTSRSLVGLMGGQVDAQKLVSSCTLFGFCAQLMLTDRNAELAKRALALATTCRQILDTAERQGLQPCFFTLDAMPDGPPCGACGSQPAPDPPTGSAIAPCSYGRCLKCMQDGLEAEFIFEGVYNGRVWPEGLERAAVMVDGKRLNWRGWQEHRGLPLKYVEP